MMAQKNHKNKTTLANYSHPYGVYVLFYVRMYIEENHLQ